MTLRPLAPVLAAPIADTQLLYAWDEWDVHQYFHFAVESLEERLVEVSGRGAVALTIATGEWICQRYAKLNTDPAALDYLEAAWAEQMQPGSAYYVETDDDDWRGLVRAPLSLVITIVNDALFCLDEDSNTAARASYMANLARHVLPSRDAFDAWLDAVLDRLALHHPASTAAAESFDDDAFGLGRPVARELFDTTRPFVPAQEKALVEQFVRGVDPQNPFLAVNA